jgi:simple sugar transport system permease protein
VKERVTSKHEFFLFLIIVVLSLYMQLRNPSFLTVGNLFSILEGMIEVGLFAVGMFLVIVSGDIDLSITATAVLTMYATTKILLAWEPNSIFVALLISAVIGMGLGLFNGFLVTKFNLPGLIVTLGTLSFYRGFMFTVLGEKVINNMPKVLLKLQRAKLITVRNEYGFRLSLPSSFLVLAFGIVVVWFITRHTLLGRGIFAVGGNRESAKRVGFNVNRIKLFVFATSGVFAGLSGLMHGTIHKYVSPFEIVGSELNVIAAVVLGGTLITGGKGSVLGTVLGVALITVIRQNLILLGVSSYWEKAVVGLLIIASVLITNIRDKIGEKSGFLNKSLLTKFKKEQVRVL